MLYYKQVLDERAAKRAQCCLLLNKTNIILFLLSFCKNIWRIAEKIVILRCSKIHSGEVGSSAISR